MSPETLPRGNWLTRRKWLQGASALAVASSSFSTSISTWAQPRVGAKLPQARPKPADRRFTSPVVEATLRATTARIADPDLAVLFENCFPNTLDTTVYPGTFDGKPDTHVVTGDIDAMWLRDSSAQVWPYLPLLAPSAAVADPDPELRRLIAGVIHRQTRLIRIDPYANAFTRNLTDPPLSWAVDDKTQHKPGVGERKWEIDSLCYPIRLAHGYWKATGDSTPFDQDWQQTAWTILETFRQQQRKSGPGPYSFERLSEVSTETLPLSGYGNPAVPVGMIFSGFRPSDDACVYPLFVPANLFAVRSLRQMAELAVVFRDPRRDDAKLQVEALALANEVEQATERYGLADDARHGRIWAYEVDGYGNALKMDDANAPGLLSLAYLGCCRIDDPLYRRTRNFALSPQNPYFFRGAAAEGIGGPHEGLRMIWPMSILMRALTSTSDPEIRQCLRRLRDTTAQTGFMHESFDCDDPAKFTRPWFAWANTLYGELILKLLAERPHILASSLG